MQKDRGYELEYVGDDYLVKKGCDIHGDIIIPQSVFNNRTKIDRIGKLCLICNPLNSNSSIEIFVKDILDEYNISYQMNTRKILNSKKELDFYIEDKNIAIECNGVYWHSEAKGENKLYHINKTQECEDLGISLIHLWEDEIKEKPEIIKSMLLNKLELTTHKIYARKCDIREISANDYTSFLNTHHIQGAMNSKVKLGLFNNDELCAVMGLGSLRISLGQKSKENVYELHRYAVKQNTNIIGGASKLFKYFIRNYEYEEIISYARRDYSKGNLYDKLGFTFVRNTEPNYFWVINSKRENRFKYRKSELPKIFKDIDLSKTEVEIMHEQGYYRIWDCGNKKYIYKK
ncbi:MAG: hypothetical protein RSC92_03565 [Clostridia bacterium]